MNGVSINVAHNVRAFTLLEGGSVRPPVGKAFRVCEFENSVVCLRIMSSPELMPGFGF